MNDDVVESECDKHGLDRHVFVHEAGHAVAAIDNGLEFRRIVLFAEDAMPKFADGLVVAPGAVEMLDGDPATWVPNDMLASMRFLLGGAVAERAVLGHEISGGWRQDIITWRIGAGRRDLLEERELTDMLGQPLMELYHSELDAAYGKTDRIVALADHLGKHSGPWEMPYDKVVKFLNGHEAAEGAAVSDT
ncbi:hypothetical protein [Aeromicrobium sp. P5_D10]